MEDQTTKSNNLKNILNDNKILNTNSIWGDTITHKEENTCRIYFHNIRNLAVEGEWQAWTDILETMKHNDIDIFGLVEPNINWTKKLIASATKIGKRLNNQQFIMQTSTSEEYSSSHHKRGGTILCTTKKMVGNVFISGKGGPAAVSSQYPLKQLF